MEMPQPDNQEPKDPNSPRTPQKATKARAILYRFGVPAIVVLMGVLLVGIVAARVVSSNNSHSKTLEKPISDVLNLADHHVLKSVTISGNDIFAIDTKGQHYHAVKEDGQSVTEIFRHDGVIVSIDNGQQNQWMQGLLDFLLLGVVIGALYLFFRRGGIGAQASTFARSKAKRFNEAKEHAPCIIFIDEIDAVGRHRNGSGVGGNDEREQTLNQLLVELDGFDKNTNIVVIAATNRPDVLDPALLRPGRFDRQVMLDKPDIRGRLAILEVHAKGKPLANNVALMELARQTVGFSGADLSNLLNEAALLAARRNQDEIRKTELEEAILRVMAGPERKSRVITEAEKKIIAYHEVGHAIVMRSLRGADPVYKVTAISRGMALGITVPATAEDRYLMRKSELLAKLAGAMGGRAAEEIIFGDITTGASQDIEYVTNIARRMV